MDLQVFIYYYKPNIPSYCSIENLEIVFPILLSSHPIQSSSHHNHNQEPEQENLDEERMDENGMILNEEILNEETLNGEQEIEMNHGQENPNSQQQKKEEEENVISYVQSLHSQLTSIIFENMTLFVFGRVNSNSIPSSHHQSSNHQTPSQKKMMNTQKYPRIEDTMMMMKFDLRFKIDVSSITSSLSKFELDIQSILQSFENVSHEIVSSNQLKSQLREQKKQEIQSKQKFLNLESKLQSLYNT